MIDKTIRKKRFKDMTYLILLIFVVTVAYFRYKTRTYTETRSRILMDTVVEISLTSAKQNLNEIISDAFAQIEYYEGKLSYFNSESMLWKLNHSDADSFMIDNDFHNLLTMSKLFYDLSENLFDVTIAPLLELWSYEEQIIPTLADIEKAQQLVNFDRINFGHNYLIKPNGIKLNFGGLAKGYIIDKVIENIVKHSTNSISGYINAGGDIRLFNKKRPRRIGVQHPRDHNSIINILEVKNMAVVTSGDYERFFELDGIRYHHIINPFTGFPAEKIVSVTVISETAFLADVLSTTLFLMEPDEGIGLVKQFPNTEAIIHYPSGDTLISLRTEGIKNFIVGEYE